MEPGGGTSKAAGGQTTTRRVGERLWALLLPRLRLRLSPPPARLSEDSHLQAPPYRRPSPPPPPGAAAAAAPRTLGGCCCCCCCSSRPPPPGLTSPRLPSRRMEEEEAPRRALGCRESGSHHPAAAGTSGVGRAAGAATPSRWGERCAPVRLRHGAPPAGWLAGWLTGRKLRANGAGEGERARKEASCCWVPFTRAF